MAASRGDLLDPLLKAIGQRHALVLEDKVGTPDDSMLPAHLGGNSVRYTFMVERSRNGASENDPARRDMIEKRFAAEIASSAVPGWFKAAVSRGLNPPEAGK